MRKLVFLFFCIFVFTELSGQGIKEELQSILTNRQLMGMSALVVSNDSILFSDNLGIADYGRNIPVTDSTIYRVASISKTVTATALMMLYEKKLFKLDEDISKILGFKVRNPNYPKIAITPRMLLSHTSSLQDGSGYGKFMQDTYLKNPPPSVSGLLTDTGKYFTADLWQKHAPGTFFSYCNLNFGIIATLIEKLSGTRFDIFCKERIFDPLGIKGSFNIQDIQNLNNFAVLYRANNGIWKPQADNFVGVKPHPRDLSAYVIGSNGIIFGPQGGLHISPKDLAKILILHMNGGVYKGIRLLKDSTVALMHRPQWIYTGFNGDTYYGLFRCWGLGFQIMTNALNEDIVFPGYSMTGHIGESYGMISDMFYSKKNKCGVIFITNGCATDYDWGISSAFYAVDEDVFSGLFNMYVKPQIKQPPNSDLGNEYKTNLFYSPPTGMINARFYLSEAGFVTCRIYNSTGIEVAKFDKKFDSYGRKQVIMLTGNLENGIYSCVIQSGLDIKTLKLNICK